MIELLSSQEKDILNNLKLQDEVEEWNLLPSKLLRNSKFFEQNYNWLLKQGRITDDAVNYLIQINEIDKALEFISHLRTAELMRINISNPRIRAELTRRVKKRSIYDYECFYLYLKLELEISSEVIIEIFNRYVKYRDPYTAGEVLSLLVLFDKREYFDIALNCQKNNISINLSQMIRFIDKCIDRYYFQKVIMLTNSSVFYSTIEHLLDVESELIYDVIKVKYDKDLLMSLSELCKLKYFETFIQLNKKFPSLLDDLIKYSFGIQQRKLLAKIKRGT